MQIRCDYEPGLFGEEEFYESPAYGRVHKRTPLHNTAGDVFGGMLPSPMVLGLLRDVLTEDQLQGLAARMLEEQRLRDWLTEDQLQELAIDLPETRGEQFLEPRLFAETEFYESPAYGLVHHLLGSALTENQRDHLAACLTEQQQEQTLVVE